MDLRTLLDPENTKTSERLHYFSDVDSDRNSQHHTIGVGPTQAAAGNHNHNDNYVANGPKGVVGVGPLCGSTVDQNDSEVILGNTKMTFTIEPNRAYEVTFSSTTVDAQTTTADRVANAAVEFCLRGALGTTVTNTNFVLHCSKKRVSLFTNSSNYATGLELVGYMSSGPNDQGDYTLGVSGFCTLPNFLWRLLDGNRIIVKDVGPAVNFP